MKVKASLEFTQAVDGLKAEVQNLKVLTDDEMEDAFFEIGAILKLQIEKILPRSLKEKDSRKGSSKKHTHLQDDVKYWVGIAKKSGQRYVSAFGGKETGYKWAWVNDGYIHAKTKRFVPGIHFLEKALNNSEGMIEDAIDDHLEKAVNND